MDIVQFYSKLTDIMTEYQNADIEKKDADKAIKTLLAEAKKAKLKIKVSEDILDDIIVEDPSSIEEEEISYDEDGSIVC